MGGNRWYQPKVIAVLNTRRRDVYSRGHRDAERENKQTNKRHEAKRTLIAASLKAFAGEHVFSAEVVLDFVTISIAILAVLATPHAGILHIVCTGDTPEYGRRWTREFLSAVAPREFCVYNTRTQLLRAKSEQMSRERLHWQKHKMLW